MDWRPELLYEWYLKSSPLLGVIGDKKVKDSNGGHVTIKSNRTMIIPRNSKPNKKVSPAPKSDSAEKQGVNRGVIHNKGSLFFNYVDVARRCVDPEYLNSKVKLHTHNCLPGGYNQWLKDDQLGNQEFNFILKYLKTIRYPVWRVVIKVALRRIPFLSPFEQHTQTFIANHNRKLLKATRARAAPPSLPWDPSKALIPGTKLPPDCNKYGGPEAFEIMGAITMDELNKVSLGIWGRCQESGPEGVVDALEFSICQWVIDSRLQTIKISEEQVGSQKMDGCSINNMLLKGSFAQSKKEAIPLSLA
ncbi:unnamed protein product [Lepeophtheirus salmonis]|uniref:(salmon louse) hypothetical protein n=1 Tax=Lepeophtheirus salmonis TaxID=72036 RepID=A0A7R8D546_LEPSM|nr:unnamed protein product [Lepeophtheirus salmonis]CAF3031338.1 unnamed protein product [Lepeophtheirus salmonis]